MTASLEATDAASRAVQKTPNRVSLDSIKAKIAEVQYINPEICPTMTLALVKMTKRICIYHDHCMDGFTAAWVIWRETKARRDEIAFIPATYGSAPPDVTGAEVIIVDFSYPREELLAMAAQAKTVTVLDHHKTAAAALSDLSAPNLIVEFDMTRSGARMAWDFMARGNHGEPCPLLVRYVEDRDLWRWAMPHSREINAWLGIQPKDFQHWTWLDQQLEMDQTMPAEIGTALLAQKTSLIGTSTDITLRYMTIGGHRVPVANLPPALASEAGNILAEGNPFAAIYSDTGRGRQFSLRSTDAGLDVSVIAKALGGGGHRNAAGFLAPRGWEGDGTDDDALAEALLTAKANLIELEAATRRLIDMIETPNAATVEAVGWMDDWLDAIADAKAKLQELHQ